LFESVLPPELLRLPVELERVDAPLDDPAFFAPFEPFFDPRIGRPFDADGDLPAADVPEVPVPAGLREPVSGGVGLDHVAAVLPDPSFDSPGSASRSRNILTARSRNSSSPFGADTITVPPARISTLREFQDGPV